MTKVSIADVEKATAARDEFLDRVEKARESSSELADLMAEAIRLAIDANGLEPVGRDGRARVSLDSIMAAHCMIEARDAYLRAKRANA